MFLNLSAFSGRIRYRLSQHVIRLSGYQVILSVLVLIKRMLFWLLWAILGSLYQIRIQELRVEKFPDLEARCLEGERVRNMSLSQTVITQRYMSRRAQVATQVLGFHSVPLWKLQIYIRDVKSFDITWSHHHATYRVLCISSVIQQCQAGFHCHFAPSGNGFRVARPYTTDTFCDTLQTMIHAWRLWMDDSGDDTQMP